MSASGLTQMYSRLKLKPLVDFVRESTLRLVIGWYTEVILLSQKHT